MMSDALGIELDRLLEVAGGVVVGSGREIAVDDFGEAEEDGVEAGHFIMPGAEDMIGVVVGGIEGDGFFGVRFEKF